MKFEKRTTAPSTSNKYYLKYGKGGYNRAMEINKNTHSCLANCVAMAHGRWLESIKSTNPAKDDKLPTGNAENYYPYKKDGYKRGKTPKLGAIICWRKGEAGKSSDGAGHVAFVEEVKSNGDVLTSNSAYGGKRYYLKTYTKKSGYYLGKNYHFQGFIYNPVEFDNEDFDLTRILKRGSKGADVTQLQKELKSRGYNLGKSGKNKDGIDGDYGKNTEKAVKQFQKDKKAKLIDGAVGRETAHLLGWTFNGK